MNQIRELIWLKSNKAKESTEGDFLQRGFECAQQHRSEQTCWYSWEGRKVWAMLLLLLQKCTLDYKKRCRGKIWVLGAHMSRLCHILLWLFQLWLLLFFRLEGKKELLSPAVILRNWLCNRTWLQQIQKHFFTELCIWTWTEDDSPWLCSFWTNYTALWRCHCTRCLCPGIVCHGYNVQQGSEYIKVSGRWGF